MTPEPTDRCSQLNHHELLAGSALTDQQILVLEQPGSWGRDAVAESGLESDLWQSAEPSRVLLARHPNRTRPSTQRHWWTLQVKGSDVVTNHGQVAWSQALTDHIWSTSSREPAAATVFLCTNGKRDRCCAEFARALLRRFPDEPRLWEISHLGGHRFAPTALAFPSGLMFGKLDSDALEAIMSCELPARQQVRGRVGRSVTRQVAEIAAAGRLDVPITQLASQDVSTTAPSSEVTKTHVLVSAATATGPVSTTVQLLRQAGPLRPKSCGKPLEQNQHWRVTPESE